MEPQSSKDRQLTIHFHGGITREGKVPVTLLAEKLHAIQTALYNIGSALLAGGTKGAWKSEVLQACSLSLIGTDPTASLDVLVEVSEYSPDLFDHLGAKSIKHLHNTVESILTSDRQEIQKIYPDRGQRIRVLKSVQKLLPEEESDYYMILKTIHGETKLDEHVKNRFETIARNDFVSITEEETVKITGKLYLIEVGLGHPQIGLRVNNRNIPCDFPSEFEDVIRDLIPGSTVEVEGRATLNDRGDVAKIEEIFDARSVQLIPSYWTKVYYDNHQFDLKEPITITVNFLDGLWIHECEYLSIIGYGKTRSESLDSFRMEFDSCWFTIAQEDDNKLSYDALDLKKKLLGIVKSSRELA